MQWVAFAFHVGLTDQQEHLDSFGCTSGTTQAERKDRGG